MPDKSVYQNLAHSCDCTDDLLCLLCLREALSSAGSFLRNNVDEVMKRCASNAVSV
jgi:hypothetical protein